MIIRAFIALEIPEAPLNEILAIRDKHIKDAQNFKWEPLDKLHITLKFLGDVDEPQIENIAEKIDTALAGYTKLQLSFSEFGIFRKDNKPRIFWLGLKENETLINLALEVDNICSSLGFEREKRKFKSHITLLRIKNDENINSILSMLKLKLPEINFTSDKITIFKSVLKQSGSVYTLLKSFYIKY